MTDEHGKQIELRMGSEPKTAGDAEGVSGGGEQGGAGGGGGFAPGGQAHAGAGRAEAEGPKPVMGWIAVGCGLLGIFTYGFIFVPIAFVCSIIALFMGQGMWSFLGFLTAFVGLMTSPALLAILGLGALAAYFGIPI